MKLSKKLCASLRISFSLRFFTLSTNIGSIIKNRFNNLLNIVYKQFFTHERLLVEVLLDRLLERFSRS